MMRRSLTRTRIASALNRSAAWQAEKNAAPSPETAASFGASSRNSNVDHNEAANSAAIDTPMTTPSPISAGASDNPFRPDAPTGDGAGRIAARRAIVGDAGAGERERGQNAGGPGRRAGGDQAAENRAERHAGGRSGMQPRKDRAAEPPFDPRAFGVHGDVDDAPNESRRDKGDGHPRRARGVEDRAQSRAEHDRADRKRPLDAETVAERSAGRHGDEIGAGVDGENDPERRRVDPGARQNCARGAAP